MLPRLLEFTRALRTKPMLAGLLLSGALALAAGLSAGGSPPTDCRDSRLKFHAADARCMLPKEIDVGLAAPVENGVRKPVLMLIDRNASSCAPNYSGDLVVRDVVSDRWTVDVKGFEFWRNHDGGHHPMICETARALVPIDMSWLDGNKVREVQVNLGGASSRFTLSASPYSLTLSAAGGSQSIEVTDDLNFGRSRLKTQVVLYPLDVGRIYLSGNVVSGSDYAGALADIARRHGLLRVQDVYPGIEQPVGPQGEQSEFLVVIRNPAILARLTPSRSLPLESVRSEKGIQANLALMELS